MKMNNEKFPSEVIRSGLIDEILWDLFDTGLVSEKTKAAVIAAMKAAYPDATPGEFK
jgi:hypothetical protein